MLEILENLYLKIAMQKQFSKLSLSSIFILLLIALGCQSSDSPTPDEQNKGMILNSPNALEVVPEADIDQESFKLPASFTLEGPPIISQQSTSKCVAFSGAYYILSMYNGLASTNNDVAMSPEFPYAQYKKTNNDNNCSDGAFLFNEGGDKGLAEILRTVGTTTWNQTPFVNSKVCTINNSTQVTQAATNKVDGYYRLDKAEYNNINEIKTWLYGGYPLWFAVNVEDNWDKIGTGTWKHSSGKAEPHAMVIVGYDDAKKALKIANSWGTNWGENGYGWVDYDFFVKLIGETQTIGVLYPNESQKVNLGKLSPGSCSKAGWGRITLSNQRNEEIAVVMTGVNNYLNDNADNTDAKENQDFVGIPKGVVTLKVYNKARTTLIKEYQTTVTPCEVTVVTVN